MTTQTLLTPTSIRIVDVPGDLPPDVPPRWRRRPVASADVATSRHVMYDPRAVAVIRCGSTRRTSPLATQLAAQGYRPLDAEPAVWWRPRAAQHAAAA